jgi:hypothetical protein
MDKAKSMPWFIGPPESFLKVVKHAIYSNIEVQWWQKGLLLKGEV